MRRALLLALLALLLGRTPAAAQETEAPPLPPIPNEPAGWILVDADTGAVLAGRAQRTPRLPASTIKLLTALVAAQRLPPNDPVPISPVASGMPARIINAEAGQTWDREDLLASMLLVSANDAAVAMAEHVGGGSLDGWERVAGTTAEALGLEDSPRLADPAGLDDEFSNDGGSTISPRDLAIVARAVLDEPELLSIVGVQEIRFVGGDGINHVVDRRNQLLDLYPGAIGLKTGLTDRAGRCLVAAATRDGRTMLAVFFDAPDMYLTAGLLLDHGFATPVAAEDALDVLPEVVPDAALDPPERIPGALDVAVTAVELPSAESGIDWQSAPVAAVVLCVGAAPALLLRRRMARRSVVEIGVPDHADW